MTQQEIFDKVAVHLLTQGRKSVTGRINNHCMYRGIGNTKCAIGCLIPDKLYDFTLEGITVNSRPLLKVLIEAKVIDNDPALLNQIGGVIENEIFISLIALQKIHDTTAPQDWKHNLNNYALRHGLNTLAIDNLEIANIVN